jgi:hypothetical protein
VEVLVQDDATLVNRFVRVRLGRLLPSGRCEATILGTES